MQQRRYFCSAAVREHLLILESVVTSGLPIKEFEDVLKGLIYLISDNGHERDFSSEGYYRFLVEFSAYYRESLYVVTKKEFDLFYSRLMDFLNVCFPIKYEEVCVES